MGISLYFPPNLVDLGHYKDDDRIEKYCRIGADCIKLWQETLSQVTAQARFNRYRHADGKIQR